MLRALIFFAAAALVELSSLKVKTSGKAQGPFVEGAIDGAGRFVPAADATIKGWAPTPGPRPSDAMPGWVDLGECRVREGCKFHGDTEAVSPRTPRVHGYRTRDGAFHPDSPPAVIR
jgi:hypothetical protein